MHDPVRGDRPHWSSASAVRSAIADLVLGPSPGASFQLIGNITLREHQQNAVDRLTAALAEFGGALLADATGLGKTFVAASIAAQYRRPLIVLPAALRPMWRQALDQSGVVATLMTFEALSSAPAIAHDDSDLVIVDEAHHARTAGTRRYARLARLTTGRPVLLLTATPLHNRPAELIALLGLFLGSAAADIIADPARLGRCVIRRSAADVADSARVPDVAPAVWLPLPDDAAVLASLEAIPPPVPPADGGEAHALVSMTLMRLWASSDAALVAALRARLVRGLALESALLGGRHPTVAELRSWIGVDSVQLGFPEFLGRTVPDARVFLHALGAHVAGVRAALRAVAARASLDDAREQLLRDLLARHEGERVVMFSSFAETVRAIYRRLRSVGGLAALTGNGAMVAGGVLARHDVLTRFAPVAHSARPPVPAEAIHTLVTTDLLSEGVNLQDASVVVHLDVPWTAARLEQRVGRAARIGAAHDVVTVYAIQPPASAERVLGAEQRIRSKAAHAAHLVGGSLCTLRERESHAGQSSLPLESEQSTRVPAVRSAADSVQATRALLSEWRAPASGHRWDRTSSEFPVAAVHCSGAAGALVVTQSDDGSAVLLAHDASGITLDPARVRDLVSRAGGADCSPERERLDQTLTAIEQQNRSRSAARSAGIEAAPAARARRLAGARIASIVRRAPRHARAHYAQLATAARETLVVRCGAGGEQMLRDLTHASMSDDAWLRAMAALGAELHGAGSAIRNVCLEARVSAVLLLQPQPVALDAVCQSNCRTRGSSRVKIEISTESSYCNKAT